MLNFSLSPEQIALQKKAREFALKEILPVAWYYDEIDDTPMPVLKKAYDEGGEAAAAKELAKAGILSLAPGGKTGEKIISGVFLIFIMVNFLFQQLVLKDLEY